MEENVIWLPVVGFDRYEVSNTGLVRRVDYQISKSDGTTQSFKSKLMKFSMDRGYYKVHLSQENGKGKTKWVHRLVAEAFLGLPVSSDLEVNHIDENKLNNHVSNLEWVTHRQNLMHNNLHLRIAEKNRGRGAIKVAQYDKSFNLIKIWDSFADIRRAGLNHKNVHRTCQSSLGLKETSGYYWAYL